MTMSPVVVGVDLGTGGARAVALASNGDVKLWMYEPFEGAASWPPGRADPAAWLDGLHRLLVRVDAAAVEVAAVAVGGQSPTTVPLAADPAGNAVSNDPVGLAATCRHRAGNGLDRTAHHLAQLEFISDELGRPARGHAGLGLGVAPPRCRRHSGVVARRGGHRRLRRAGRGRHRDRSQRRIVGPGSRDPAGQRL